MKTQTLTVEQEDDIDILENEVDDEFLQDEVDSDVEQEQGDEHVDVHEGKGDVVKAGMPERMSLSLPSYIAQEDRARLGLEVLAVQEIALRQGQANDCLDGLRLALADKSLAYCTDVRLSKSTTSKTKAWDGVKAAGARVNKYARAYNRARLALIRLGAGDKILDIYQPIREEDLKVSADIVEENRYDQKRDKLAWFWRIGVQSQADPGSWMEECGWLSHVCDRDLTFGPKLVYQVNWLRTKARYDRFEEEVLLVKHEMGWTIRFFENEISRWTRRADKSMEDGLAGHAAYAEKQIAMWRNFAIQAQEGFNGLWVE